MKLVKITYGVGFGRHTDELEFEDGATDEEIEDGVRDYVMDRFYWGFEVIESDDEEPTT